VLAVLKRGGRPRSDKDLKRYIQNAVEVDPDRPVLVDKYLDRADELDVDALCDKDGNVVICGIMQHIEQAGVHSGARSPRMCSLPPLAPCLPCAARRAGRRSLACAAPGPRSSPPLGWLLVPCLP
jgi:hypothetical protein